VKPNTNARKMENSLNLYLCKKESGINILCHVFVTINPWRARATMKSSRQLTAQPET
jgi:hypothetical protein